METIEELTPDMTGTYLVTTQGSQHLWNLDKKCYIRMPKDETKSRGIPGYFNEVENYWAEVHTWPKVGSVFITLLHGDMPWHQSSTIKSIELVE